MAEQVIREKLIEAGVKNLTEFGYPQVNTENILTDIVYAGFFTSMLKENLGKSNSQVDEVINRLLGELQRV